MARNEDKPGKLSALEPQSKGRQWLEKFVAVRAAVRPGAVAWVINVLCGLALLYVIAHPQENVVDEWTGTDVAPLDFKVPRDLEVLDVEGTGKKQQEAESKVRSVYDFDPGSFDNVKKQTSAFFGGFRELYPQPPEPISGDTGAGEDEIITVPDAFLPEKDQELLRAFNAKVSTEDLDLLKANYFAPEIEQALIGLVKGVYFAEDGKSVYMVPNKELLLKERDKGVTAISIVPEPDEQPVNIDALDAILDLADGYQLVDKNAKKKFADMDPALGALLRKIGKELLDPNLTFNKGKTEEAKKRVVDEVKPLYYKFKKDEIIVRKGDRIKDEARKKINVILTAQQTDPPPPAKSAGYFLLTVFVIAVVVTYSTRNISKFKLEPRDMIFLAMTMVLSIMLLRGVAFMANSASPSISGLPEGLNFYYLVPLAGAAMLARMVLNSEVALIFSIGLAALGGLVADSSLLFAIYTLVGSMVAAGNVAQCRQRSSILRAGLVLGLANVIMILFISMITGQFISTQSPYVNMGMAGNLIFGFSGGIVAAIIITGLVPLAENVFSYATDIKLLELLNQDHPILKELSMKTPGTQQHSLMVANLAEAAAKEVGANPLLARVCAMYHDVGKMEKPLYFAENQWDGDNVHDRLQPSMSTLIIHNHVKEGVELAEKYKLPGVIVDTIKQHHGTSLLKYFYEKAKELDETGVPVEELDYRYPGPKPQTREVAIILLADVVEASAKSIHDPNPVRLKGMVQNLINRAFVDGQLDECDLTLQNLHDIARSFNQTLGAIYRARPEYPQPVVKGAAVDKKKKAEHDAAKHKDKANGKTKDDDKKDKDESDNTLKRLGM